MSWRRSTYYEKSIGDTPLCACGCGLSADHGSRFKRGHGTQKHRNTSRRMHHRRRSKP